MSGKASQTREHSADEVTLALVLLDDALFRFTRDRVPEEGPVVSLGGRHVRMLIWYAKAIALATAGQESEIARSARDLAGCLVDSMKHQVTPTPATSCRDVATMDRMRELASELIADAVLTKPASWPRLSREF